MCNQQTATDATNDGDDMLEDAQQDEIEGQISQYSRRTRNFFHAITNSDSEESSDEENVTAVAAAVPLAGEKDVDSDWEEYDDMYGDAPDEEITSYD